jgi:hypothetical protein
MVARRKGCILPLLILSALFHLPSAISADLPLSDGDRIVIEGDSYAQQYKWSCYLAAYWILGNPSLNLHVQVVARSGTKTEQALTDPTGYHGYDEYNKTVYALQSDWVLTNYGDNGGDTVAQFIAATTDLNNNYIVGENSATPILIGAFPALKTDGKKLNGDYETAELTLGWQVGAVWHYLAPIWEVSANWPILSTTLNSHVDTSGNILEFYSIIHTLGFSTVVANATINAYDNTLASFTNCAVTNIYANANGGIDFDRLDTKLPWAIDHDNDGYNKAIGLLPEVHNWQDYSITITNLSNGSYDVLCDGVQIGSGVTDAMLSHGWNMSDLQVGPVFTQGQDVLNRIRDMQGVGATLVCIQKPDPFGHLPIGWRGVCRYGSNATGYYQSGQRGATLIASLQPALTEVANYDALIHAAAQPLTRHYSVRSTGVSSSPTPTATATSTSTPVPTPTATCTCV